MKIKKFFLFIIVLVFIFNGCFVKKPERELSAFNKQTFSGAVLPLEVTDLLGRKILFDSYPETIVSLVPAATEVLYAAGAGDRVTGVTEYCTYPPEAQEKEVVGGYSAETIILEKIIYLNPDLVIAGGDYHSSVITSLEDKGIKVFSMEMRTVEDVYTSLEFAGFITRNSGIAESRINYMKEKEKQVMNIVSSIPENDRIFVFWEVWYEPLMTAGGKSFINELIQEAGGINIFSDSESEFPVISSENVIYRNPDVIISSDFNKELKEDIKNRIGWDTISAVINNRIYLLNEDIISRPGPRIINALGLIVKNLYPDIFTEYFDDEDPGLW